VRASRPSSTTRRRARLIELHESATVQKLIDDGLAEQWEAAGSMLVLKKLADLPANFQDRFDEATST
jgi:uncharacterized lipoprotein YajG